MSPMITRVSSVISLIILIVTTLYSFTVNAESRPEVKTDKDSYNAGETISVNFFNASGSNHDWICIAAAGSPDDEAGDYKYLPGGVSQGLLTFDAPATGKYEVRAYYNYSRNGYVVSARHSFAVIDKISPTLPVVREEEIRSLKSPAANAFPADGRLFNVAVFYFTPLSMEATNYSIIVTNTLTNAPKMQSSFIMLGRKDIEIFLSANNLQQNDQINNIIEIGTKLGLNYVITGSIRKKGTAIVTDCRVIGVEQRNIIFFNQLISKGEADLINGVMKMSNSIVEAILRTN
jgi:TolB-like protein